MAALFLLLVLLASGGGGHDVASLELRGIPDSCHKRAVQVLMDIMSISGCGRFAGLLAATPHAREVFRQRLVGGGGGGGGLTVFCPDDKAVAAFEPTLRAIADDDRLAVLLHHGAAARYVRTQLVTFEWVAVPTLAAAEAATNRSQTIFVGHQSGTLWLDGRARITRTVSSEEAPGLVVHVVDAVLLPRRLRQKLDGEDDQAALCRAAARFLAGSGCTDAAKIKKTTTTKPETLF